MTAVQWFADGGAYALLGIAWIGAGILSAMLAGRIGRRYGVPNDGCLLGFAMQVLVITGGALAILPFAKPNASGLSTIYMVIASSLAAFALPGIALALYARKLRRGYRLPKS